MHLAAAALSSNPSGDNVQPGGVVEVSCADIKERGFSAVSLRRSSKSHPASQGCGRASGMLELPAMGRGNWLGSLTPPCFGEFGLQIWHCQAGGG